MIGNYLNKLKEFVLKGTFYISKLDIISSYFAGSALAKVITKLILEKYDLATFIFPHPDSIPGLSYQTTIDKTRDITEFLFIIASTVLLYLFNLTLASIRKSKSGNIRPLALLTISLLLFSETTFLSYSSLRVTLSIFISFIIINLISTSEVQIKRKLNYRLIINGLLTGFYLMILIESSFTSVTIPLVFFVTTPFIYLLLSKKSDDYYHNPAHLLLLFSAFITYHLVLLLIIGTLTLSLIYLTTKNYKYNFSTNVLKYLYAFSLVFIFAYNPLFYLGTYDPIEEGFWLGWLQHLLSGQVLYKDVTAYHPPILTWGLYLLSKIFSPSIYLERMYFHILKIVGLFIIYILSMKLIRNKLNRFAILITILILTTTNVRNNVEIRTALGVLSILPLYAYFKTINSKYLIYSGVISGITLFSSLEIGLATVVSVLVGLIITSGLKKCLRLSGYYLSGLLIGVLPFILILLIQGSLSQYIDQMLYYSKAFSSGYLNTAIPRFDNLRLMDWDLTYKFLDSMTWFWEMSLLGIIVSILNNIRPMLDGKPRPRNKLVIFIGIFSLLIGRIVLGRSDSYHLIFVLPLSLILLGNFLESLFKKKNIIFVTIIFLFINIYFFRNATNLNFMVTELTKFQSYGKAPGNYPNFDIKRGQILTDIDTNINDKKSLIKYVEDNTSIEDKIFIYPWNPEVYFLANRSNATSFDTPLAFYTPNYQEQMIKELKDNSPKIILYNSKLQLAGLNSGSLSLVDAFIKTNYKSAGKIAEFEIMENGK